MASIAVAQTLPVRGDVDANILRHLRLISLAAGRGAQLLVFPELSLTGYELDLAAQLAFSEHDPRLAPLLEAAASHSIILIVGAPVGIGARLHIGAFILFPDRSLELYTKHHLGAFSESARRDGQVPPAEATVFAPGERNPLLRFGGESAALAVCADTGRPSHPRQAAERGASYYLASMFVIPSDFEREVLNLSASAARHSMVVAFANYGGPSGGLAAAGRSAIWSERGELLVELGAEGEGIALASRERSAWRAEAIPMRHPDYSATLLDHFHNPRNVGVVPERDAEGTAESPLHGDTLRLSFALEGERIREVRFLCLGCPVAIAAGSIATLLLGGRSITQALALEDEDVIQALGGIPEHKRACSLLVREAVAKAFSKLAPR